MRRIFSGTAALAAAVLLGGVDARADLLISANDGKGVLVNGVNTVPASPVPDSVSIYDLSKTPPQITTTILMPIVNHDNNQHSFDENLRIQNLWDGIELMAALLAM